MRHTKRLAIWIAAAAFLAAQSDPPSRVGRLNYTDGPVSFQPAGEEDWIAGRARGEMHVGSAVLRLGPNTAFQFINLDDQTVQVRPSEGTLTVHLRDFGRD